MQDAEMNDHFKIPYLFLIIQGDKIKLSNKDVNENILRHDKERLSVIKNSKGAFNINILYNHLKNNQETM